MTKVKTFTVGLPVTDLNSAVEWYRRLLGEVEEVNPAPGVWEFQIISSGWLQLFESEINHSNLAVVRFESDDIEASRLQALSLGTDVSEIETVPEAVRYFEFRDPFGNQLSFYEYWSSHAQQGAQRRSCHDGSRDVGAESRAFTSSRHSKRGDGDSRRGGDPCLSAQCERHGRQPPLQGSSFARLA